MRSSPLLKAIALLVFVLLIGGAVLAVQSTLGGATLTGSLALKAEAPRPLLNATAGHVVTFDVVVTNRGAVAELATVNVSGALFPAGSATVTVPAGDNMTAFVPLQVPAGAAPGAYPLDVTITTSEGATRTTHGLLQLRVLPPTQLGFDDNASVDVIYTGRLAADGKVFNTNDPVVLGLNFLRTTTYLPSTGALPVQGGPQPQVVQGFYEALRGIQAGESRTVTIPSALAYGDATTQQTLDRLEVLDRDYVLPVQVETVARATFDSYMNQTGQKGPFAPGDVFHFIQGPNRWPYKIATLDGSNVGYVVDVAAGQNYTLYPFWVNASAVISVNDSAVVFRTTPTTAVGQAFTMRSYWPDMSALESVNDTKIVVKHSPPVGFKYTLPATQTQQAQDVTIESVNDTAIVTASPSNNPLAGQDLTFDILALDVAR